MHAMALLLLTASPVLVGETFWEAIQPLCGKAFAGRMIRGSEPTDADFAQQEMIMHVAVCGETEVRIPFHVGENRSRTWVLTRHDDGVRLKHDHRHEDGTEDDITQYGGDTLGAAKGLDLDFHADQFTAELIPAAANNIWTIALKPGERFIYQLRREAQHRYFTIEFDLSNPVPVPPPAW